MAFNWPVFRTRAITAIAFAAVMLMGLLWNHWSFLILFSIIHFGCWWEYLKLTEKIHVVYFHLYTKLGLMLIGYGLVLWFCGEAFQVNGYQLKENISMPVSAAGFILLLFGIFQKNTIKIRAFGAAVVGVIYISLSWGLMIDLYNTSIYHFAKEYSGTSPYDGAAGPAIKWSIPIITILAIWINDTMAYLVGSLMGRTPLSKISPKKTWEGTIGGIILAVLTAGFVTWLVNFHIFHIVSMTAIVAIAGTFGDLLESKLKRRAGVKDSGSLMPGHGGFLDRFDSLLLATPFVWLFIQLFIK